MLSKEMYTILKSIPRHPNTITFDALYEKKICSLESLKSLLCDAIHTDYEYATQHHVRGRLIQDSSFSLSERGKAAIEEYEQNLRNQTAMEKSLAISKVAMVAAIASAIAAMAPYLSDIVAVLNDVVCAIKQLVS